MKLSFYQHRQGKIMLLPALILMLCFLAPRKGVAQLNEKGTPVSFEVTSVADYVPFITMPALDMDEIAIEDAEDEKHNIPPRFGYLIDVNLNLDNAGNWEKLPNGDRIWRMGIRSEGALSLNLNYDKFWLPNGGKLFIYSASKKHVIGAFTARNNKGTRTNLNGFATGLVYEDAIILEYYEPAAVKGQAVINIDQVSHGYRYIRIPKQYHNPALHGPELFGQSGNCQVNVNCPEGNNWQDEKKGVAVMLRNGSRICTGSLINNTSGDGDVLFLTADHCIGSLDAQTGSTNASNYSFLWNYESPGCNSVEVTGVTTSGATLIANNFETDFALFRLSEDPRVAGADVYYNGWNRTESPTGSAVGIHHPRGDVKKIATENNTPTSYNFRGTGYYWRTNFDPTTNGHSVTEGGSSGSPLFDANGRILGQLYGGSSANCGNPFADFSIYGKVSLSWDGFENFATRRLRDHLNPSGAPVPTTLNGAYIPLGGNDIGESGSVSIDQTDGNQWRTINLQGSYTNPVVVMGPITFNGPDPTVMRVRNVTSSSFEYQMTEWDYKTPGAHTTEEIGYMVIEAGTWDVDGKRVQAGYVNAVDENWKSQSLSGFSATPVVLSQVATFAGSQACNTRQRNVSSSGFEVRVQEEEGNDGTHADENIAYIAIETGGAAGSNGIAAGLTGNTVDEVWETINFPSSGYAATDPFIAQIQTFNGGDPCDLRKRNQGSSSVQVFVEEEASSDTETGHVNEVVGYVVINVAGQFSGSSAKRGTSVGVAAVGQDLNSVVVNDADLQLYPNPAGDWFEISYTMEDAGEARAELMNVQGRLIQQLVSDQEGAAGTFRFETAGLPAGIYFVRVYRGASVDVLKVMIQ